MDKHRQSFLDVMLAPRNRRKLLILGLLIVGFLTFISLQLYAGTLQTNTLNLPTKETETQPQHVEEGNDAVTYLMQHPDPQIMTNPTKIENICNNLPKNPRRPHEVVFTERTAESGPIKIFRWRQQTFMDNPPTDWKKESQTMCPFPPELQPFFNFNKAYHVKDELIVWKDGFAPCWFWYRNVPDWLRGKEQTCDKSTKQNYKYITTSNYTEFRDADIILIDYPFYNYIEQPPYWEMRRMPPRLAHQKWVLDYGLESIAYYSHVALGSFLQQFDLTMGAPGQLFDVSLPLQHISEEYAMKMAEVTPKYPFDDKDPKNLIAWVISNCNPTNRRNEVIQELITKAGGHSYGKCMNMHQIPKELLPDDGWDTLMEAKRTVLSKYPFAFVGENSNCVGYVTEKIYDAFESGAIPVYIGASDIADFVPEKSYIDVSWFKSTDDLIHFLRTTNRAPFFAWKEKVKKDASQFCKRCFKPVQALECTILDHTRFA
ncbi:hypothetical protein BCR41DRAFT_166917 [Lobosporangium transversale]|uniref:Fucosyltransferase n=1 Tax=Lobosporangium transversale TaxID=64571 RepID=A0A1Y2GBP4_9FUNG|nr:hypothetical protein BCR41DRAFT_166917 [Lobosporangium transversale]ORZ06526.1 hypothetical protein BCR41DRAFT_166917 [Lobosporangium transversale]|eukprot:XP_021877569.1 hypothetical protein BCR41DRAFT_166917 [Lobosporangium transversale]